MTRSQPRRRVAASAVAAVAALTVGAGPVQAAEELSVDTHRGADQALATSPVTSRAPLLAGEAYVITMTGTASIWGSDQWALPNRCGAPEDRVVTQSEDQDRTPAGIDAETVFAAPQGERFGGRFTCVPASIPFAFATLSNGGLKVDLGDGYKRLLAEGGPYAAPRVDHSYAYRVVGQGRPAAFRYEDQRLSDNNGAFRVTVRTLGECQAVDCLSANPTAPTQNQSGDGGVLSNAALGLPSSGRCVSRRAFTIRLRKQRGVRYRSARVTVGGKRVAIRRRGGRLTARVVLRGRPNERVVVRITAVTTRGQVLRGKRTYRTCTKRRPGKVPPL